MEYIEVFTREGKPTGKTIEKHEEKLSGEYFRHVLIIMKTKDSPAPGKGEGRYVVQQRSLRARYYAGKWDMTGGGVRAGETPKEAAVRELSEELGITVSSDELEPAFDYIKDWDDGIFSTLPVTEMVEQMIKEGISSELSYTAGTYVCNDLFYRTMNNLKTKGLSIPAGFIHVPNPSDSDGDTKSELSISEIARGIKICIETIIGR